MSFCGSCGNQIVSDSIRFCPDCGAPTISEQGPAPGPASWAASGPAVGVPAEDLLVEDHSAAPDEGQRPGAGKGRRWLIPVAALAGLVLVLAGTATFAVRLLGGSDANTGAWMWQQSIDDNSFNYGLAVRDGDGFTSGPPVGVGSSLEFMTADDRTTAMPAFAGGFAALISRSNDGDGVVTLSVVSEDDGSQVVSEWAGSVVWLSQAGTGSAYALIDAKGESVYFSIQNGGIETCYRVDAKELKPVQIASGTDCRWSDGKAVLVQHPEGAAPRFTVFDRVGQMISEGAFPAGDYSGVEWTTADGWIRGTRSIVSDSTGDTEGSVIEIFDLATGQPVATLEGQSTEVLATADGGRGLVVAIDKHEEKLDVLLVGPDGKVAGTVEAPLYASALITEDGQRAWIDAQRSEDSATVHFVTAGAEPKQVFKAPVVRLLHADADRLLMATQGSTTSDYRVVATDTGGQQAEILAGRLDGSDDSAAWQVSYGQMSGRGFVLGPDGAAGSIWEVLGDKASKVATSVDIPQEESDTQGAELMAGTGGELVLTYSQARQAKIDVLTPAGTTPLAQGPRFELLGVEDGQVWYNSVTEGSPTATYRVPVDGKDLPTHVNLMLGATPQPVLSQFISGSSAWTSNGAWIDPIKTECKDSGYPVLGAGDSYASTSTNFYVCAQLDSGDSVVVSPNQASATYYISATDSVGSDQVQATRWTASRSGFYKIYTSWSCWYCTGSGGATKVTIKGGGGA